MRGGRRLMMCAGAVGLAGAMVGLAGEPAQAVAQWPVTALCAARRTFLTRYELRLVERRTTRMQARRVAAAAGDPS